MAVETSTSSGHTPPAPGARGLLGRAGAAARGGWGAARRHPLLALFVLAVLIGALAWLSFAAETAADNGYVTAIVQRGDIEDTVTAVGNLQPRDYVDVGAQVSGQLKKLYVDIGDQVKEGQLLAEIDPRVLDSKVESDKSNLANLKAQLADRQAQQALAQANFDRQKRLMAADATSRSDYDSARQALQSARAQSAALEAQIAAAQSQLAGDQVTLGYTKIYAPMDGTVVSVSAKQGQTLNANQQAPVILRVADLSVMTVWTQVSEADVPKLKLGMPAYFTTLGEPNTRWTGTLTQIQPTPDVVNNVVLYTATFDVKNPDHQLMTQMTAQVFFVVASAHDAITVPVAALHLGRARAERTGSDAQRSDQGAQPRRSARSPEFAAVRAAMKAHRNAKRAWVQVVDPDGRIVRRPVAIGVSNRVTAQVLAGLEVGERVIVGTQQSDKQAPSDRTDRSHRHFGPRL